MNKKLFFGMFVAAGMLLATSCSKDELETVQSGNEAQVTFSLGLENNIGTRTRAISDGKSADKLIYAVFDENGQRISSIQQVVKENVTFPATETLTLAKGQTYKVVFWAQDGDCKAYTVSDDMKLKLTYQETGTDGKKTGAKNNDEKRDAFFKAETFTVTGSTSKEVTLKRPFAQINVGVTTEDWNAAMASGIEIEKSSVVINDAALNMNLLTGEVSGTTRATYNFDAIPTEELQVDADGDGTKESYKWLSMSYILVNDDSPSAEGEIAGAQKATLNSLTFELQPKSGNSIILKEGLTNVPVQRNWRTNILGKLLTGDTKFVIKIDPAYEDDNNLFPGGGATELAMVAKNGGTVTLTADVALTAPLYIATGKSVVINLNGKNIVPPTGVDRTIQVGDGAELTINGEGTIGSLEGEALAVSVLGGKLTVNGGTFYGGSECSCIYLFNSSKYDGVQNAGNITINGGSFKVNAPWNGFYYVLNMQNSDGDKLQQGTITVKGGKFENYDPSKGDDHDQPTNFVDEANGYFSVKTSDNPAIYEVMDFETVLNRGGNVNVLQDISTTDGVYINESSDVIVDVAEGVTVTSTSTTASTASTLRTGNKSKNVTIKGNGTIMGPIGNTKATSTAAIENAGSNVVIEGNLTVDGGSGGKVNAAVHVRTGCTTIKNGYFKVGLDKDGNANSCIFVCPSNRTMKAKLIIEGGVFETEGNLNGWYPVVNIQDAYRSNCTVEITGGTFINYDPAKGDNTGAANDTFVAPGYKSVQTTYNGQTAWQVMKDE